MSRNLKLFRDRYSTLASLIDEIIGKARSFQDFRAGVPDPLYEIKYQELRRLQRRAKFILRQDPSLVNYFNDLKYPLIDMLARTPDELGTLVYWNDL